MRYLRKLWWAFFPPYAIQLMRRIQHNYDQLPQAFLHTMTVHHYRTMTPAQREWFCHDQGALFLAGYMAREMAQPIAVAS